MYDPEPIYWKHPLSRVCVRVRRCVVTVRGYGYWVGTVFTLTLCRWYGERRPCLASLKISSVLIHLSRRLSVRQRTVASSRC